LKYIYARTSTQHQNVDQQADHLLKQHLNATVLKEQESGRSLDRPVFNELRSKLQEDDIVVVLSVSRLGRNTEEVLALDDLHELHLLYEMYFCIFQYSYPNPNSSHWLVQ